MSSADDALTPPFRQIAVTPRFETLYADVEQALMRLHTAEGRDQIEAAYGALCMRRKELYYYVSTLESLLYPKAKLRVLKRFD